MDKINIEGVILTPLNKICHPKGDVFHGMKILDVGSGPMPSATCFTNCQVYCLDPLVHKYLEVGYPLHYFDNVKFIQGISEKIPIENDFFDVVISVNSIDHVDNLQETSSEIDRVLNPRGLLRIHYHFHLPKNVNRLVLMMI